MFRPLHAAGEGKAQTALQMGELRAAFAHLRLRAAQAAREPIDGLRAAIELPAELGRQRIPVTPHVAQHACTVRTDQFLSLIHI